jgi:hypothetical protein
VSRLSSDNVTTHLLGIQLTGGCADLTELADRLGPLVLTEVERYCQDAGTAVDAHFLGEGEVTWQSEEEV